MYNSTSCINYERFENKEITSKKIKKEDDWERALIMSNNGCRMRGDNKTVRRGSEKNSKINFYITCEVGIYYAWRAEGLGENKLEII